MALHLASRRRLLADSEYYGAVEAERPDDGGMELLALIWFPAWLGGRQRQRQRGASAAVINLITDPAPSTAITAMNIFATTGALLLASLTAVSAHGNIVDPAAVWEQGYPSNGYISEVSNEIFGKMDNSVYGYGAEGSVKYFTKNFPDSGVTTLRDLIMENQKMWAPTVDPKCGYTILDEAKRATMPASGKITFSGFSHPGPCELWCDDNKLAFANDCATTYPDAKVPFDAAKCANANQFTIYWIGVQGTPWQVYTNCVYLKGGKASSASGSATTPKATTAAPKATTVAPKATTAAPKATTATPVANDADAANDEYATDAPAGTTSAPATTPASTPAATKKKCTAKVRRV